MRSRKPTCTQIEAAPRLSSLHPELRGERDDGEHCYFCGRKPEQNGLRVWREHDALDVPLDGPENMIRVCYPCERTIIAHPRMHSPVHGLDPDSCGTHSLCRPCVSREGLACTNRLRKPLGGPGMLVSFDHLRGIACLGRGRSTPLPAIAIKCAGFEARKDPT